MIIVVTQTELNEDTGRMERIVSHGFDTLTGKAVILPSMKPEEIGALFDRQRGEFVLPGRNQK